MLGPSQAHGTTCKPSNLFNSAPVGTGQLESFFKSFAGFPEFIEEENGRKGHVEALFARIEGEPPERHDFVDIGVDTTCVPGGRPREVTRSVSAKSG